jgi:hypothetical protein
VTPSRSTSCDSSVASAAYESFLSPSYGGNTGDIGIEVNEGNVGREIDREETLLDHDEHHVAVDAIRAVWPDAEIVDQWLTADELFPGSGQCKDCGDPLNGTALMQRCRGRHQADPGVKTPGQSA